MDETPDRVKINQGIEYDDMEDHSLASIVHSDSGSENNLTKSTLSVTRGGSMAETGSFFGATCLTDREHPVEQVKSGNMMNTEGAGVNTRTNAFPATTFGVTNHAFKEDIGAPAFPNSESYVSGSLGTSGEAAKNRIDGAITAPTDGWRSGAFAKETGQEARAKTEGVMKNIEGGGLAKRGGLRLFNNQQDGCADTAQTTSSYIGGPAGSLQSKALDGIGGKLSANPSSRGQDIQVFRL